MSYANSTLFSNELNMSKYAQSGTLEVMLDMPQFMAEMGLSLNLATQALKTPAAADAFIKNILYNDIYVGGRLSDINFMTRIAGGSATRVKTKEISNRYLTKKSNVVFFTSTRVDTTNAGFIWGTLAPSSHMANGTLSAPFVGCQLTNKSTQQNLVVVDENKSTNWAHEICVAVQDIYNTTITQATLQANQGYFVSRAAYVGGVSTEVLANDIPDVGWMQLVRFATRRRDWKVAIDVLSGWKDDLRFSLMPTSDGRLVWSWLLYQQEEARYQLRLVHSKDLLQSTPISNPSLINNNNNIPNPVFPKLPNIDNLRTGYYGLEPSIRYGGGLVYPYPKSTGFDFDRDGERIFARQNALMQTTGWLFIAGQMARYALDRSATKLISQQGVGSLLQDIYKKGASSSLEYMDTGADAKPTWTAELSKWSIDGYKYHGQEINIKTLNALSDVTQIGSDELSHRVYCMPLDGVKHMTTGAPMNPIEILQFGDNGYSGDFQEYFVDLRTQQAKTPVLTGWCEQSQSVLFHGMNLWMMLEGVE